MRTEDDIDGVLAQSILTDRDVDTEPTQFVPGVACLVQKTLGMNVPPGLHDGQVYSGFHVVLE